VIPRQTTLWTRPLGEPGVRLELLPERFAGQSP
jgi:hypothetical protein